jgi:hypothetical protein
MKQVKNVKRPSSSPVATTLSLSVETLRSIVGGAGNRGEQDTKR